MPRRVGDGLSGMMVLDSLSHDQFLKENNAEPGDEPSADLMREIIPPLGDPCMNVGYRFTGCGVFRRLFLSFAQPALRFRQRPLIRAEKRGLGIASPVESVANFFKGQSTTAARSFAARALLQFIWKSTRTT